MYRVGITGGIGSGKSLVCSILELFGVPVYYADLEARRLMNEDVELRSALKAEFGDGIYKGGELDRQKMGSRVFGEPRLLEKINQMVHPVVRKDFDNWCKACENVPYVVEEAAILFESGAAKQMNMSVLVYAPIALRISRVVDRDGLSSDEVKKRMSYQLDEEEKKRRADSIIINDETSLLLPQIVSLHEEIKMKI
jgi:dephospho-CoA kinase